MIDTELIHKIASTTESKRVLLKARDLVQEPVQDWLYSGTYKDLLWDLLEIKKRNTSEDTYQVVVQGYLVSTLKKEINLGGIVGIQALILLLDLTRTFIRSEASPLDSLKMHNLIKRTEERSYFSKTRNRPLAEDLPFLRATGLSENVIQILDKTRRNIWVKVPNPSNLPRGFHIVRYTYPEEYIIINEDLSIDALSMLSYNFRSSVISKKDQVQMTFWMRDSSGLPLNNPIYNFKIFPWKEIWID